MATRVEELYDEDFYAWAMGQADALRRLADLRPNSGIDFAHLVEEVEGLARAERNAVRSQLRRLLEHCLKLEHSPAADPRPGWKASIDDARHEIADRLTPTLRRNVEHDLPTLYAQARRVAAKALTAAGEMTAANPYGLDDLLTDDWYPTSRHDVPVGGA
jgi:hypothetical protein